MPETLRLTKKEQKELREKCVEINKLLVSKERAPLRDSELAHVLLEKSIRYAKLTKDGDLIIDM